MQSITEALLRQYAMHRMGFTTKIHSFEDLTSKPPRYQDKNGPHPHATGKCILKTQQSKKRIRPSAKTVELQRGGTTSVTVSWRASEDLEGHGPKAA